MKNLHVAADLQYKHKSFDILSIKLFTNVKKCFFYIVVSIL